MRPPSTASIAMVPAPPVAAVAALVDGGGVTGATCAHAATGAATAPRTPRLANLPSDLMAVPPRPEPARRLPREYPDVLAKLHVRITANLRSASPDSGAETVEKRARPAHPVVRHE